MQLSNYNYMSQLFLSNCERFANHPGRDDGLNISKIVTKYAYGIGCNTSNVQAAVTWALKTPSGRGTLEAIREGRKHADKCLFRQQRESYRCDYTQEFL